jgi:hypothetical protein
VTACRAKVSRRPYGLRWQEERDTALADC